MRARIVLSDGSCIEKNIEIKGNVAVLPVEDIPGNCEYVDFLYDYFTAEAGDCGYFVLPFGTQDGVYRTNFIQRQDTEFVSLFSCMGCYGCWNTWRHGRYAL